MAHVFTSIRRVSQNCSIIRPQVVLPKLQKSRAIRGINQNKIECSPLPLLASFEHRDKASQTAHFKSVKILTLPKYTQKCKSGDGWEGLSF